MIDNMKKYDSEDKHILIAVTAVAVSLIIHTLLIFLMADNPITWAKPVSLTVAQKLALKAESSAKVKHLEQDPIRPSPDNIKTDRRPDTVNLENILFATPTDSPSSMFEPPALVSGTVFDAVNAKINEPVETEALDYVVQWQPRSEIISILDRMVYGDITPFNRREVPSMERTLFAPDITLDYEMNSALKNAGRVGTPAYVNPAPPKVESAIPDSVLDSGERNIPESIEAGPAASGAEATTYLAEIPSDVSPAEPIEEVLKTSIAVHRPKRPDGYIYFQIDVERRSDDVLPVLPRDILLVQDASASLAKERLAFCNRAFKDVISELRPVDRFNILKFNTRNTFCFGDNWEPFTPESKARAEAFIDAIQSEGNTDIYNAMKAVLNLPRDPDRIALVILVSDGKTTAGDIRRDSQIIGEFSKLNDGGVSVFAMAPSKSSNNYLLSMLSLCNRGGHSYVSSDRFTIPKIMGMLANGIQSPVLSNIRFLFDSQSDAEVVPVMPTHLYLDRPMQLLGRVRDDVNDVVFQARGEANGKKYDMVFKLSLGSPGAGANQNPELVKSWADARMYEYVAEYVKNENPATLVKMEALGRQYSVTVPFKEHFRLF